MDGYLHHERAPLIVIYTKRGLNRLLFRPREGSMDGYLYGETAEWQMKVELPMDERVHIQNHWMYK